MIDLNPILARIQKLTEIDKKYKTPREILACPVEELGELARELKIEGKVHGNTYKQPSEGSAAEAVDLFIGAICMYFVHNPGPISNNQFSFKVFDDDVWKWLECAVTSLGNISDSPADCLELAQDALYIFLCKEHLDKFIEIANKKLDKWEWGIKQNVITSSVDTMFQEFTDEARE